MPASPRSSAEALRTKRGAAVLKGLAAAVAAALAAPWAAPAGAAEIVFQAASGTPAGFNTANAPHAPPTPTGPYTTTALNTTTAPPAGSLPPQNAQYSPNVTAPGNYVLYARVLAFGDG